MNPFNSTPVTPTTSETDTFVIEPLAFKPTIGEHHGRFVSMEWDTTPKKKDQPRRDLVLVAELKDENGQLVPVPHRFNCLPRGRGVNEFKKQMEYFFGKKLTAVQLAGLKRDILVDKPVIVRYKKGIRDGVTFDKYLPAQTAQPLAAQPVTA